MGSYTIESDILSSASGKSLAIASARLSAGPLIVADHLGFMILRSVGEDGLSRVAFLVMNETLSPWSDDVFDMVITDDLDSNCRVKSGFHVVDIPAQGSSGADFTFTWRPFIQ
jgi:hypothetical protein